jgi:hypothetical protein
MCAALLVAPLAYANTIGLTITDASPPGTLSGTEQIGGGAIAYVGVPYGFSIDGWEGSVTGTTYPADGSPSQPMLDLNTILIQSIGTGNLVITFGATGYTGLGASYLYVGGTSLTGTFAAWYDPNNGLMTTPAGDELGSEALGAGGVSGARIGASNYSLTEVVTITGGAPGSMDTILTIPDGGITVMMLGSALIGLVAVRSKFSRKA